MKNFLTKVFIFTSILLLILLIIEFLLRSTAFGHEYNKLYLDKNANNIEILALGASLTWSGIDPALIEANTFNAANNGQNFYLSQQIIEKYFDDFDSLKYVITQFDYDYLTRPPRSHYLYTIYYNFKSDKYTDYLMFANFPLQNSIIRIVDYYFFNKKFRHGEQQLLGNHLSTKIADINEVKKSYKDSQLFRYSNEEQINIHKNIEIISNIADKLSEKNIKLILITTPVHPIRRDWTNKEYLSIANKTAEYLINKHNNIMYFDCFFNYDFDQNDFSDSHHLNQFGAKKLTIYLADKIP